MCGAVGGSHRLLFTPAWQVILLNKATHAQHIRDIHEDIHERGEWERKKVEAQVIVHLAFTKVLKIKMRSSVFHYFGFQSQLPLVCQLRVLFTARDLLTRNMEEQYENTF